MKLWWTESSNKDSRGVATAQYWNLHMAGYCCPVAKLDVVAVISTEPQRKYEWNEKPFRSWLVTSQREFKFRKVEEAKSQTVDLVLMDNAVTVFRNLLA